MKKIKSLFATLATLMSIISAFAINRTSIPKKKFQEFYFFSRIVSNDRRDPFNFTPTTLVTGECISGFDTCLYTIAFGVVHPWNSGLMGDEQFFSITH
jgi:hypothetical protein